MGMMYVGIITLTAVCGVVSSLFCGDTWRYFAGTGYCYRLSSEDVTWSSAREACGLIGSHLTSVTSEEENAFLRDYLTISNVSQAWIGLYTEGLTPDSRKSSLQDRKAGWRWDDGETYDFVRWSENEPTAFQPENVTRLRRDGTWTDWAYWMEIKYICKQASMFASFALPLEGGSETDDTPDPIPRCDEDWTMDMKTGNCYRLSHDVLDWDSANVTCRRMNSHLVSITGRIENEFIKKLLQGRGVNETWIGLYKLGLTTEDHKQQLKDRRLGWRWTDGSRADYSTWRGKPAQPSGNVNEKSVRMHEDGFWGDQDYNQPLHYCCEKPPGQTLEITPSNVEDPEEGGNYSESLSLGLCIPMLIIAMILVGAILALRARRKQRRRKPEPECVPYQPSTLKKRHGPPLSKADISGPSDLVRDVPECIPDSPEYCPEAYDNHFNGTVGGCTNLYTQVEREKRTKPRHLTDDVTYAHAQRSLTDIEYSDEDTTMCENTMYIYT